MKLKKSIKPDDPHQSTRQGSASMVIELFSKELSVRDALERLKHGIAPLGLSNDDLGSVEVVLGEVLNNVVEHAYGATAEGTIEVSCTVAGHVLRFRVEDEGAELPFGRLPSGQLPNLEGPIDALPEGGFGWYLVRNLTCDLTYQRVEKRNVLAFSIPFEGDA